MNTVTHQRASGTSMISRLNGSNRRHIAIEIHSSESFLAEHQPVGHVIEQTHEGYEFAT